MNFKKNADGFAAFGGVSRVLNALLARFRGVCNRSNREPNKGMLVKISNKFFVFIPDSHSLGTFLDDRNQETIDHPVKILKDLFLADMAVIINGLLSSTA